MSTFLLSRVCFLLSLARLLPVIFFSHYNHTLPCHAFLSKSENICSQFILSLTICFVFAAQTDLFFASLSFLFLSLNADQFLSLSAWHVAFAETYTHNTRAHSLVSSPFPLSLFLCCRFFLL